TASYSVLPELLQCREFVNADEIAKGLSPFNPESVAIEAGKLMLQRINLLLSQGKTFAIETTLSTRSYASLIKEAHEKGYLVVLLFFWLPSPEMAIERVAKRVSEGGHNIPTETIIRRYWLGLQNFFHIFAHVVDSWMFFKNIDKTTLLADQDSIYSSTLFSKIKQSCQKKEKLDLKEKIIKGLNQSYENLLRRKAALGQDMVFADENGQPRIVSARKTLEDYEKKHG
ncbi:MAG: zeta toxin family protein, partial [Muribaculaceae bacterium]|nr:zeta toxin family protein [Muribaculaceae bacterium]